MGSFLNLKVGAKLIIGFLIVATIAAVIGLFGIVKIRQINAADMKMYEKITVPLEDLAFISVSFQRVRINARDALEATNDQERQVAIDAMNKLRQEIGERCDTFEKTLLTDQGRKLFAEFKDARKSYLSYVDQMLELDKAGKKAEAMALLHGDAKNAAQQEQDLLNKLMEAKKAIGKETAETNAKEADTATILMAVLAAAGGILAIVLGLATSKLITVPLQGAVKVANALAEGDLRVTVDVTSKDETGQLMAAMQNMVDNLRNMISRTVDISSGIASASQQLHSTSTQIATAAEEVAAQ